MRRGISTFTAVCAGISLLFLWNIWHLLPLYTDSTLRAQIKTSLTEIANREGWLLSDITVQGISADNVRLRHRIHRRGADPETCHDLILKDNSIQPCA